ncbi:hypothetical protein BO71DRAFT_326818 [Aspergillus ellipticus CBS 707.79]|uniref:PWI domain-containing protein n=1 Tax=Aspergillus ellipticus CBS 707.79 TaxID=1448320 RepID=A0A319DIE1_9EURO|nr:hypothetical protein BO71DRAFT_326818 [Aspergillus ellipticus CBS 707.79]
MATSVDAKMLRQTKFPPEFSRKVDMTKVNIEVMKKWIAGKISEILGNEDDVVIELCFNLLEGSRFPDVKSLQIQLTGFLDKDTAKFCKELWSLCLSAQENPQGVPKELLEAKKLELIQEKIEAEKAAEEARKQKEQERVRERELEDIRRRERSDRGRGGRRGGRGGGRDFDRRRSPPRQRSRDRFRGPPPGRREFDSYVPSGPRRGRRPSPSPSRSRSRSVSSSRSPPPRRRGYPANDRPRRRRSAILITVIELDPFPAVNHPARVVPEETDADADPFRPAVHHFRPSTKTGVGEEAPLGRGPVLGRQEPTADIAKARSSRDDRRLSRSRDRNDHRRRRYSSRSVGRSRSRSRSASRDSRSPSRSRSRGYARDRKRRRSIQRYAPAARRRRNTSSVSVPSDKRQRMADEDEEAARRASPRPEKPSSSDQEMKDATETTASNPARARISSSELREKLLREKIVAMRRTAPSDKVGSNSNSTPSK